MTFVQDTYSAFFFVTLKPWSERTKPEEQYDAIKMRLNERACRIDGRNCIRVSTAGNSRRRYLGGFTLRSKIAPAKTSGSWRKT